MDASASVEMAQVSVGMVLAFLLRFELELASVEQRVVVACCPHLLEDDDFGHTCVASPLSTSSGCLSC